VVTDELKVEEIKIREAGEARSGDYRKSTGLTRKQLRKIAKDGGASWRRQFKSSKVLKGGRIRTTKIPGNPERELGARGGKKGRRGDSVTVRTALNRQAIGKFLLKPKRDSKK